MVCAKGFLIAISHRSIRHDGEYTLDQYGSSVPTTMQQHTRRPFENKYIIWSLTYFLARNIIVLSHRCILPFLHFHASTFHLILLDCLDELRHDGFIFRGSHAAEDLTEGCDSSIHILSLQCGRCSIFFITSK